MLKHFFEIGTDKSNFAGLKISKEKRLCDEYMGQFPVISVTFKDVGGAKYLSARNAICNLVGNEAMRFRFLLTSDKLDDLDKDLYSQIIKPNSPIPNGNADQPIFAMPDSILKMSLKTLSQLLSKHYGKPVIVLIDEYDVPLDKAFGEGYYKEMVELIRSMFSNVLKTNDSLMFAVLTGCMRISKESIFTGLNNFNVITINDDSYSDCFGFTEGEVATMLEYYDCREKLDIARQWYDGYHFGNVKMYCPWDVVNYCWSLAANKNARPENYWANTSGNALVRRFIDKADAHTRQEIEQLIDGKAIVKPVRYELTYDELDKSIDNLWNVLFFTGYLTYRERLEGDSYELVIPNTEIRDLFVKEIREWFKDTTHNDNTTIASFCDAFPKGDATAIEKQLNKYLWNSISIRDTAVRSRYKENFYHGMLLGILQYEHDWIIKSNIESGEGYGDILIETPEYTGVVIELKYANDANLEPHAKEALEQIDTKQYEARLRDDGMGRIVKIGIAFYKKICRVAVGDI
jgi:hypothetical protein